jgi:hypothetical protein
MMFLTINFVIPIKELSMATRTLAYPVNGIIHLDMDDHLTITGWDREEIEIKIRDESDLIIRQKDAEIWIEAEDDCVLSLPKTAPLKIDSVKGSLSIIDLYSDIEINSVGGHLTLRQVKQVQCDSVGGHLKISHIDGDLLVHNVGGSVRGGVVSGLLQVQNIGSSVKLVDVAITGKMNAGGNIKMKLVALPGDFKANAGSSIKLWVPQGIGYELEAVSGSQKIQMISNHEPTRYATGHQRMTVAGGGPLIQLNAGSSIAVLDAGWEDDLSPEDLGVSLGNELDALDDRITQHVQERIRRAEENARQAAERAERRAREASVRAEERLRAATANLGRDFTPRENAWRPTPPVIPVAPVPPAASKTSESERLLILQLLSEKKISAEEANQLLNALDGKFSS